MFQVKILDRVKTHILGPMTFCYENCVVNDTMWGNVAQSDSPYLTI